MAVTAAVIKMTNAAAAAAATTTIPTSDFYLTALLFAGQATRTFGDCCNRF